jgi:Cys-tRNA(Pro)/Cys-tRNA(Cys) deacylase
MATKTNAVRLVQQAKIPCREFEYEFDENDLRGTHAAHALRMPEEQVFKTLVARGERNGIHVFCIPVCCELDLKKAAKAAGEKSIEMIKSKDLLSLTGYIHGGCSPIGMKKFFPTFIDTSATDFDSIIFSAGKIGYQVQCSLDDLSKVIRFNLVQLTD